MNKDNYNTCVSIITNSFDNEINRIIMLLNMELTDKVGSSEEVRYKYNNIINFFMEKSLDCFYRRNFFTLKSLKNTVSLIFENEYFRDFIYTLTDNINLEINTSVKDEIGTDIDLLPDFVKSVSDSINLNRYINTEESLIPFNVYNTISFKDEDVSLSLFTNNLWLLYIYVILMNIEKTNFSNTYLEALH